jgi:purine-binding chemotaxis protein CheW
MISRPLPPTDAAAVERILAERARKLARPTTDAVALKTIALVELDLGENRFGVNLQQVEEIQPLQGLTPVPGVPAFWAGVVNLRGRLYPVLDLRHYLNLNDAPPIEGGLIVVVSAAGLTVALWTNDVPGVRQVPQDELQVSLLDVPGVPPDLVSGVTADLLCVLDLDALLSDPRLVIQEAAK